jgi:fido (protein-threonine AMPylation protein)
MNPIADSLARLQKIAEQNNCAVLHTRQIARKDRELLLHHHWLQEIIRGWYLLVRPDMQSGESTAWYGSFWDFVAMYLQHHYGENYCLSAESSLDLHIGSMSIHKQIIVIVPEGAGNVIPLPHNTSMLIYSDSKNFPTEKERLGKLQVMSLPYALCKIVPSYFIIAPQDAEIALRAVTKASDFLKIFAKYQLKNAAERLIGAYRFLGQNNMAEDLQKELLDVGIIAHPKNPFETETSLLTNVTSTSPHALRIHAMWKEMREVIIAHFPEPPKNPKKYEQFLDEISEKYTQDAYNSLSIEGYKVSNELIEKVKKAKWKPDLDPEDRQLRDSLAARGYYEAFESVKESVKQILNGKSPGKVVAHDLQNWFRKLFSPCVQAGIFPASDLFGYRQHQVYIGGSLHIPLSHQYLEEAMDAFFLCLAEEPHPAVRAILGHFIFVYIHPYMDGNGRIGRFLMNVMFVSGGYPWTIIHVENRKAYMKALESASCERNLLPFTKFIAKEVGAG